MRAGDQQFFRREARDDFAAIFGDDDFFFETRGGPAVGCGPVGFQREDHAFFDHFGMIEGNQAAEDRFLPDRQADAVAILQCKGGFFVGEAELFALWARA